MKRRERRAIIACTLFVSRFQQYRSVKNEWNKFLMGVIADGGMAMIGLGPVTHTTDNPIFGRAMDSNTSGDGAERGSNAAAKPKKIMLPVDSSIYTTEAGMSTVLDMEVPGYRGLGAVPGAGLGHFAEEDEELELRDTDEKIDFAP